MALQDYCARYAPTPTLLLYAIDDTILVMAILYKGQLTHYTLSHNYNYNYSCTCLYLYLLACTCAKRKMVGTLHLELSDHSIARCFHRVCRRGPNIAMLQLARH